jgi:hypothetical protein
MTQYSNLTQGISLDSDAVRKAVEAGISRAMTQRAVFECNAAHNWDFDAARRKAEIKAVLQPTASTPTQSVETTTPVA